MHCRVESAMKHWELCMHFRPQSKVYMPGRRHAERQCARIHRNQAPPAGQQRQRRARAGRVEGGGQGLASVQGDAAARARHRQQPTRQPGVRAQRLPLPCLRECCNVSDRSDCLLVGTLRKGLELRSVVAENQAVMRCAAAMGHSTLGGQARGQRRTSASPAPCACSSKGSRTLGSVAA